MTQPKPRHATRTRTPGDVGGARQRPLGPRPFASPARSPETKSGRPRGFDARPDARAIAASVIERVLTDSAYAAAAISAAIERHPQLDDRGRALLTEIVYSTLRTQKSLLSELEAHAPRGLPKDPAFLSHLMVAAVQILHLDHRRAPVAVDVAVTQINVLRGPRMAGFANAILRKLVAALPQFDRADAARHNVPEWLRDRLTAVVGTEEAERLLGIVRDENGGHPVTLRLRPSRPSAVLPEDATAGRFSPLARRVVGKGDPRKLLGYTAGDFVIQEEGAQLIALAVNAQPGERLLDACAGRGQKTTLLVEQVGPSGGVCATDIHPKKLEALNEELARLGLSSVTTQAIDWSRGSGDLTEHFDGALVDAPCTGTGTLRRRPEILLRIEPDDAARLAELATSILRHVAERVRPGGRVVYAVCSVLPEEGERVVEAVADIFELVPFEVACVQEALGQGASMGRLLPGKHGTDGYFLANLRRR